MNRLVSILLLFSVILSCKKGDDDSPIPDDYSGETTALKNGLPWSGLLYAEHMEPDRFFVRFHVYNDQNLLRESMTIFLIPEEVNHYIIDTIEVSSDNKLTGATYSTLLEDGDVLGDLYDVLEGEENFIDITHFDPVTGAVEGEYQVTFVVRQRGNNRDPEALDTVRFTNGIFKTTIKS